MVFYKRKGYLRSAWYSVHYLHFLFCLHTIEMPQFKITQVTLFLTQLRGQKGTNFLLGYFNSGQKKKKLRQNYKLGLNDTTITQKTAPKSEPKTTSQHD